MSTVLPLDPPEGIPNICQTHALTASVLTSSVDHVQNLLPQSCSIRSFVFLHLVGIHDDCKEHIHQEKYHNDHEKPKPNRSPEQACCTWATTGNTKSKICGKPLLKQCNIPSKYRICPIQICQASYSHWVVW